MELLDWLLLVAFVYVLIRCIAMRIAVEGLIAYMVANEYKTPTNDEIRKINTWVVKKHLGIKTDWRDMP